MLIYLQMIETDEDKSKFEEIYEEYLDLLLYLANRRLRNRQDAEDAVHKVFVKLVENIQRIEPVSPKTKRLVVIMIENTVTDMLRSRGRHPAVDIDEDDVEWNKCAASAPEENLLETCILRLPERQRAVIWLKYHDGYDLREIAKMLGLSLSAAQKIDQRAKQRLRERYREEGGEL